jgi:HME family heavy-metal exporter
MLNAVIRFALNHRLMIVVAAMAVMIYGAIEMQSLPIDVLPDLTRPRVVLITECPGYAPEEVETLVTIPLETALNGANGVIAVRTASDIGLSVIYVEFDWNADVYTARQIVQERISIATERLPKGIHPQMAPTSSLLGQIMIVGMWSEDGSTGPLELRTQADWVVRKRLLTIRGVSQVITMGGGRKQFQVLVDPHALHTYEVTLHEIETALGKANLNVTGGYLEKSSKELLVRGLGRIENIDEIEEIVVKRTDNRTILLGQLARVTEGAQIKRGDSSINGKDAVVLNIQKQPGADTRELTEEIRKALDELRGSLPADIVLRPTYEQREFIDYSVDNVVEALWMGALLVVVILFLFLLNFRTTFITLTAIPLSVLTTALIFRWFDMSINVMTLGGIAVALGELVDDAIVDVENIFRRLRDNARSQNPRSALRVVYEASLEVRGAIIISTVLVILVFSPLFALAGMPGRMFTPLGIAYIVSILASTVVSLTVTPVLSFYLLPRAKATAHQAEGAFVRLLKWLATPLIRLSMNGPGLTVIMAGVAGSVAISVVVVIAMGKDFLPSFDEGAAQVNVYLPPGTSLAASLRVRKIVDGRLKGLNAKLKTKENPVDTILDFTGRTGRAELDEHVMGVNVTEYILKLNPDSNVSREELIAALHTELKQVPGIQHEVEQPIAHLISHMLSGVQAEIAIKLYGDDLNVLRRKADEIKAAIEGIPGIAEPFVEQQQNIPQLRIELQRDRLAFYGMSAEYVNEFIETALNGRTVSTVLEGERTFDLLIRLDEPYRTDYVNLHRMPVELPDGGGRIPLSAVAHVYEGGGPNTINREDARRRIVIRVNTLDRDVGSAVTEIRQTIGDQVTLPEGYFVVYGGQFEAQQEATERILLLSVVALVGVFLVLYSVFPSVGVVAQILIALPAAFVGGVAALILTDQTLSVASMVGFISLGGIAARNGILLVSHYLHLYPEKGFTKEMILQGNLERLAPVLMTALTTGIGLVPLVVGGHLPGKEILFPVATVILGGLVTSTLCEFLVRPGLFWFFSEKTAARLVAIADSEQLKPDAAIGPSEQMSHFAGDAELSGFAEDTSR